MSKGLVEAVFLAVVFSILIYIGPGSDCLHRLNNEKPVHFGATDGFGYSMLAGHVYDAGNFRHNPYYGTGGFNDSIAYHPPLMMHYSAAFAHLSGIRPFDALALLMAFFVLASGFIMYWLIRSYNARLALLCLPLFVFLYVTKFVIGYIWGEALLFGGTFFLILLFFLTSRSELKHWWVPAGLVLAGLINTHTSEAIFFYGFVVFMLCFRLVSRQLKKADLKFWAKQLALATLLAVILSINYLLIFYNGYVKVTGGAYSSLKPITPEEFGAIKVPPLQDFHWPVLVPLLAGVVIALLLAWKNAHIALLSSGFMFLVGMTNYIGLHYRAFQTRFIWPVYLAVFFGLALYFVVKRFSKSGILVPAVAALVLLLAMVKFYYVPISMNVLQDGQWDGFEWIGQNTPRDVRVLFFFGDGYSQSARLLKRQAFQADPYDYSRFLESLPNRTLKIEPVMLYEMKYIYRKGFFDFGYYASERNMTLGFQPMDVCGFDYYVVDRASGISQQHAQANVQIANLLLGHNVSTAYQNGWLVILKNNNVGGECLG